MNKQILIFICGLSVLSDGAIPFNIHKFHVNGFTPHKSNAKEWVQIAKSSGLKCIVITTKHHDGFCMNGSTITPFNIVLLGKRLNSGAYFQSTSKEPA